MKCPIQIRSRKDGEEENRFNVGSPKGRGGTLRSKKKGNGLPAEALSDRGKGRRRFPREGTSKTSIFITVNVPHNRAEDSRTRVEKKKKARGVRGNWRDSACKKRRGE